MSTGCQKDRLTGHQTDRKTYRKIERLISLVVKTKVVQNVGRMSESQTDRQKLFTMSTGCHSDTKTGRQTGQSDRKTERLFRLVIKTKVVHNVNRMSER